MCISPAHVTLRFSLISLINLDVWRRDRFPCITGTLIFLFDLFDRCLRCTHEYFTFTLLTSIMVNGNRREPGKTLDHPQVGSLMAKINIYFGISPTVYSRISVYHWFNFPPCILITHVHIYSFALYLSTDGALPNWSSIFFKTSFFQY